MPLSIKSGGQWQSPRGLFIKAAGQWSGVAGGWIKSGGQWKKFWPVGDPSGYTLGGYNASIDEYSRTVVKTSLLTDVSSYVNYALPDQRNSGATTKTSSNIYISNGNNRYSRVYYGLDFSIAGDTAIVANWLNNGQALIQLAGAGNGVVGYTAGGSATSGPPSNFIGKITYATKSVSSGPVLVTGRQEHCSLSAPNAGYFTSGNSGSALLDTTEKTDYPTDTDYLASSASLGVGRVNACSNGSNDKGFVIGGYQSLGDPGSVKIAYATDTSSSCPSANYGNTVAGASFPAGPDFGFVIGGGINRSPSVVTTNAAYKIVWATETLSRDATADTSYLFSGGQYA